MGSVNETLDAWRKHYEILWEDTSDEGIAWTQEGFDFFWNKPVPLPQGIIREVERCAEREEIAVPDCTSWQLPAAAMTEASIARAGEGLQPWQQAFVAEFLRHRDWYGKARLLLADEVGVFAAKDPGQKAAALRMVFEARKLAKPDDPRLVAVAADEAIEKQINVI